MSASYTAHAFLSDVSPSRQVRAGIDQQAERFAASSGEPSPWQSSAAPELDAHGNPRRQTFNKSDLTQLVARYNPNQSPYTLKLQLAIKALKGVVTSHQTCKPFTISTGCAYVLYSRARDTALCQAAVPFLRSARPYILQRCQR